MVCSLTDLRPPSVRCAGDSGASPRASAPPRWGSRPIPWPYGNGRTESPVSRRFAGAIVSSAGRRWPCWPTPTWPGRAATARATVANGSDATTRRVAHHSPTSTSAPPVEGASGGGVLAAGCTPGPYANGRRTLVCLRSRQPEIAASTSPNPSSQLALYPYCSALPGRVGPARLTCRQRWTERLIPPAPSPDSLSAEGLLSYLPQLARIRSSEMVPP